MFLLVFPASAMLGPSPSLYMATTATLYSVSGSSCCSWAVVVVPGTKTYIETKNMSEMKRFGAACADFDSELITRNQPKKREGQRVWTLNRSQSNTNKNKDRSPRWQLFLLCTPSASQSVKGRKHQITLWWVREDTSLTQSDSEDSWLHSALCFPLLSLSMGELVRHKKVSTLWGIWPSDGSDKREGLVTNVGVWTQELCDIPVKASVILSVMSHFNGLNKTAVSASVLF